MPVFIRRITAAEVKEQDSLPPGTLLDKTEAILNDAGETKIVVTSAVCTHLGCIPIPYLGAYNGYVINTKIINIMNIINIIIIMIIILYVYVYIYI